MFPLARVVAWKDLMEIRRDKKTLAFLVLSAWLLPILAVLSQGLESSVVIHVAIVDLDCGVVRTGNTTISSRNVAEDIGVLLRMLSKQVIVKFYSCRVPREQYDVVVVIPRGFTRNITSFNTPAYIELLYNPGSQSARNIYTLIRYVIVPAVSKNIAEKLIVILAAKAGIKAKPGVILDPLRVKSGFIGVSLPQGQRIEKAVQAAHLLAFATIFVLAPASMLTVDMFVGERERRTLELLLSTPLTPSEIVAGKMVAATIVAVLSGAIDSASMLVYLLLSGLRFTAPSITLLLVHVVSTMLAIMVTSALTALTVISGIPSRLATLASSLYTLLAFFVYAASLTVDYTRLPLLYQALLALIPYTYSVNAIVEAARGNILQSGVNIVALLAYTLAAIAITAWIADPEKIIRNR